MTQIELDSFDIKILDIIQRNNRLSTETLARKVNLSPSTVQRRLKRLRKARVIEAERAVISLEAVGQNLTAIIEVTLESEHVKVLNDFKHLMIDSPQVAQCYYVTGGADFIIIMTTATIQDYEAFANHFFLENPSVRRFKTRIVIQRVKASSVVPLNATKY